MKQRTNKQLIKAMSDCSVSEAFLLTAVEKYCQTVLEDQTDWGDKSLINQDLWKIIAQENLDILKEHYK